MTTPDLLCVCIAIVLTMLSFVSGALWYCGAITEQERKERAALRTDLEPGDL